MNRDQTISALKADPQIDVLIIGGGINGAATFLDMAMNGLRVLLIDRGDFCSGASSTSSHMAHGGIRYLENGEFGLVREAVAERNRMIRNAPHIVKPLPTVIPIFKFWSGLLNAPLKFLNLLDKPSERGALIIKLGLIMYDSFTGKTRTVPAHKFYRKNETLKRFPHINKDVKYSAVYFDGQILSPERLNLEIILEGKAQGEEAFALNYVEIEKTENGFIVLRDQAKTETLRVKPKMIINAAGPWVDLVNDRLGIKTKYIGGTKGSHIIVNNPKLREAVGGNEFFFENKDGRIVLLFPYFNRVIIGTSDLPIDNPDSAICTPEEVDYFIELVKRVFPEIPVTHDQIVFRFSGVRPLEYQKAKTTGQITRDHSIKQDSSFDIPVLSMVGGKLTSFRAFGAQVTDLVLQRLSKTRLGNTENIQIGGGKEFPVGNDQQDQYIKRVQADYKVESSCAIYLFMNYGKKIESILEQATVETMVPLVANFPTITEEIKYICHNEEIIHLDDILLRRTSIGWIGKIPHGFIDKVAEIAAGELKWDSEKLSQEIQRTREIFSSKHSVSL